MPRNTTCLRMLEAASSDRRHMLASRHVAAVSAARLTGSEAGPPGPTAATQPGYSTSCLLHCPDPLAPADPVLCPETQHRPSSELSQGSSPAPLAEAWAPAAAEAGRWPEGAAQRPSASPTHLPAAAAEGPARTAGPAAHCHPLGGLAACSKHPMQRCLSGKCFMRCAL